MLLHQVSECTKLIAEASEKHLAKSSSKLDNTCAAPILHWAVMNRFLNNKKIYFIPRAFLKVN